MKLSHFIAGTLGVTGFILSMLAGLIADNTLDSILEKAMLCGGACLAIGFVIGTMAQQVSSEHALRLARQVAAQDTAEELTRLEKQAAAETEAAGRSAVETPMSPKGLAVKT